jgi:hypothetical protein
MNFEPQSGLLPLELIGEYVDAVEQKDPAIFLLELKPTEPEAHLQTQTEV